MPADLVAVVPAAGRGTRLGTQVPKVFVEVAPGVRVWDLVASRLASVAAEIHLVLAPEGLAYFEALGRPVPAGVRLSTSVQTSPTGMGDALFGAAAHWREAANVLVVWGDQVGLSQTTAAETARRQREATGPTVTLPLVATQRPYVHYAFEHERLVRVAQAREGDACPEEGLADVGLFAMSTGSLEAAWERYLASGRARGARTGETNLLPFFAHLSTAEGFAVQVVSVRDPEEARGLNNADDLAYVRARLAR